MTPRMVRWVPRVAGLALSFVGYWLANHVVPRLSDHRGHYLFAHEDRVTVALAARPRRAVVIVVDGLRRDAARGMRSVARVRALGRCAVTHVGLPSVSRPVYSVISSGVEQERSGVRNNDETSAARVDSIWERARAAGWRVEGRSELTWWRELFPRGFDRYTVGSDRTDLFAERLTADLTLLHPVYVDDASHDHGALSRANAEAVERADREIEALLDRADLHNGLVVITADHGHRDAGGHGGPSPEVTEVLTCFGGRGVWVAATGVRADSRDIAPTLAILLGISIPRNAGVGHDPTGLINAVVDREAVGEDYFDARLAGVAALRARTRTALQSLTGDPTTTWESVRANARRAQLLRALGLGAACALLVAALARKTLRAGERLVAFGWCAGVVGAFLAVYRALAGGLDASSLNLRGFFVRNALLASVGSLALGALWHRARGGSQSSLCARASVLLALLVAANATHIAAFGWPLGYPLPGPYLYFAPFLLASFQCVTGLAVAALSVPFARRAEPFV